MEQETAWKVIRAAYCCSADLQVLLKFLKDHCPADEYKPFAIGIATAIDTINVQLTDRALAARPELAKKIESDLTKFGRLT
jgi:hypothetical protein